MQTRNWYVIWRHRSPENKPNYTAWMLLLCCLLLFFSSCSNPLSGLESANIPHPTPTPHTVSVTPTPTGIRTDSNAESPLKAQLAKVQQIMARMTLEQKLGQLLIVEYIATNYSGTQLQYIISETYVVRVLYQGR